MKILLLELEFEPSVDFRSFQISPPVRLKLPVRESRRIDENQKFEILPCEKEKMEKEEIEKTLAESDQDEKN